MTKATRVDPATRAMQHIVEIDDESFGKLVVCLNEGALPHRESAVEERVQAAVPGLSSDVAAAVVGFSTAFAGAISHMTDQERFLDSIVQRARDENTGIDDGKLRDRLGALFRSTSIAFIGGGKAALRDNVQMVLRSQINTDMRPIHAYGNKSAKYFSIHHRLRFDYTNEIGADSEGTIEMVLDVEDLEDLRDRIEVALDVQTSLQGTVLEAGGAVFLPYEAKVVGDD